MLLGVVCLLLYVFSSQIYSVMEIDVYGDVDEEYGSDG